MKYTVVIEETLSKDIEVEAKDGADAEQIVREMYKNEEIVLSGDDFQGVEIREAM